MIRRHRLSPLAVAGGLLLLAPALAASAQSVPAATGDTTPAPRSVARGGTTVEPAAAARTKSRAHRRMAGRVAGTASTGRGGADAMTGSGSAAPGGPGAPPPVLPVGPGTSPIPR